MYKTLSTDEIPMVQLSDHAGLPLSKCSPGNRRKIYRGRSVRKADSASRNFWRIPELLPFTLEWRFLIALNAG
jgi:hypothetical protein